MELEIKRNSSKIRWRQHHPISFSNSPLLRHLPPQSPPLQRREEANQGIQASIWKHLSLNLFIFSLSFSSFYRIFIFLRIYSLFEQIPICIYFHVFFRFDFVSFSFWGEYAFLSFCSWHAIDIRSGRTFDRASNDYSKRENYNCTGKSSTSLHLQKKKRNFFFYRHSIRSIGLSESYPFCWALYFIWRTRIPSILNPSACICIYINIYILLIWTGW